MKCAACGYEYRRDVRYVDDVVYFKSGKRKGEVKEIRDKEVVFELGDDKFITLSSKYQDEVMYRHDSYHSWADPVYLYACPKCHTVRFE